MTTTSRPPITRVLATVDWSEKHRRGLAELFAPAEVRFAKRSERGEVLRELERVEVAVIKGTIDEAYLKAPRLRWVHCDQSGLDSFAPPHLFDTGLMVTSS
ncbi:MAG TPA: hypothetical protein VNZ57_09020, partial [Longimicrobiales bacterium]|nr:hypothetical protein [Longimicrobiales bacterium]